MPWTSNISNLDYNRPFAPHELGSVLKDLGNTAPGPDNIHYAMLRNLPDEGKDRLLDLINTSWSSGSIPADWKLAQIIPICKPGKKASLPGSYRPIALTTCFLKTAEKMISRRLDWLLETHGKLPPAQHGFRRKRSSTGPIMELVSDAAVALSTKKYLVAVFLDIRRAFDAIPHAAILAKLRSLGINGNMYNWIQSYLTERRYTVTVQDVSVVGNSFCGVPQGGVLSPRLFSIVLNDIAATTCPAVKTAIFADDVTPRTIGRHLPTLVRRLQTTLTNFHNYGRKWGLAFNPAKSAVMVFSNLSFDSTDVTLTMEGCQLPVVTNHRLLGLHLDHRLNWEAHTTFLHKTCGPRLAALTMLARRFEGASRESLTSLYKALIRSRIEYANPAFVLCPAPALKTLDRLQNRALRTILGVPSHTAVAAMEIEAHIPPLQLRHQSLMLSSLIRGAAYQGEAFRKLLTERPTATARRCGNVHQTLLRIRPADPLLRLHRQVAKTRTHPAFPPWEQISDHLTLLDEWSPGPKDSHLPASLATDFSRTLSSVRHAATIFYTDGSHDPSTGRTGFAIVCRETGQAAHYRLPDDFSILSAELAAIRHALQLALVSGIRDLLVVTDSAGSISAIRSQQHPYGQDIFDISRELGKVTILWCPSHVGVPGNENADNLAKQALRLNDHLQLEWPTQDLKRIVKKLEEEQWTRRWSLGDTGRLLCGLKPKPDAWPHNVGLTRLQSRVLAGLRCRRISCKDIYFQFARAESPLCPRCNTNDNIEHYLFECSAYSVERASFRKALQEKDIDFHMTTLFGGSPLPLLKQLHIRTELLTFVQNTKTLRGALY